MKLFDTNQKSAMGDDTKYSRAIKIPQYLPNDTKPQVVQLFNKEKYTNLVREINNSNVSDEEKEFLKLAASRHIVFNYAKIADYYANSNLEMQKLMEDSALVILDIDDAIANGFVELSDRMKQLVKESREQRGV